ncbi:hypothetical protein HDV00_003352 [Rhizophlyctis rosea]|nr:hypothetical protein HDV00_003352 [Rhizophlyctis rosea]
MVINVPLDVIHRISAYVRRQRKESLVDAEDNPSINSAVGSMIDAVTKFEQVSMQDSLHFPKPVARVWKVTETAFETTDPICSSTKVIRRAPKADLVIVFPGAAIPAAYFGADAIAAEIEEPFGMDQNDLPIDYFCEKLREDIEYIMDSQLEVDDDDDEGITFDAGSSETKKDI